MNIYPDYSVRQLAIADASSVQDLCERCSDFFLLTEGQPADEHAGREILCGLPPGKHIDDKFVLGVFDNTKMLIAVIELIRDYKIPGEWTLGLLLLDKQHREAGLGGQLHEFTKTFITQKGGHTIRLGVVEENKKALGFWQKMGYTETEQTSVCYGRKTHILHYMQTPCNSTQRL